MTQKEYIYNPMTVYIDPSIDGQTLAQYDIEKFSKQEYPYPQFVNDEEPPTPVDPSVNPADDPSAWEYDGDKNGVPDILDNMRYGDSKRTNSDVDKDDINTWKTI